MSMESFGKAMGRLSVIEGGYVDDPKDSGGPTNHGITERLARAYGYEGDMRDLTEAQARSIYHEHFWRGCNCDRLQEIAGEGIAEEVFDSAVNCGRGRAGEWLQRALNVLNREEKLYNDIDADGSIGPITLAALKQYVRVRGGRGVSVLYKLLNSLQGTHYIELAERRPKDEANIYGWLDKRVL